MVAPLRTAAITFSSTPSPWYTCKSGQQPDPKNVRQDGERQADQMFGSFTGVNATGPWCCARNVALGRVQRTWTQALKHCGGYI